AKTGGCYRPIRLCDHCFGLYGSLQDKISGRKLRVKLDDRDEWLPAKKIDGTLLVEKSGAWLKPNNVIAKQFVSTPIAQVSPHQKDTFSRSSIQWLSWRAKKDNVYIQHALNGGEQRLLGTRYKLDGYCAETNTAYEYNGDVHHGFVTCFPTNRDQTFHPLTRQSMSELYALTLKKKAYIETLGMKYICIWEHEFQEALKADENLFAFVKTLDVTERLNPRDSFFGGRTNASKLHYKVKGDEKVKYVDFTSLYPWVNKYAKYPLGHPEILTSDFGDLNDYFGIARVKILPL
ncbi:hypothetical protein ScPMuIL_004638, partial [Solemya velum]